MTGSICISPCSKQADYKQQVGKDFQEHCADKMLLTWEDRNKVKVKHLGKNLLLDSTATKDTGWENLHLNGSKLKPDKISARQTRSKQKSSQPGDSMPKL